MTAASLFCCTPVCNDRSRRSQRGAGVPSRDVLRSHSQVSSLQHFLVIALLLLEPSSCSPASLGHSQPCLLPNAPDKSVDLLSTESALWRTSDAMQYPCAAGPWHYFCRVCPALPKENRNLGMGPAKPRLAALVGSGCITSERVGQAGTSRSLGCRRGTCCTHTIAPGTSECSPPGLDGQAKHGLSGKHLLKHQAAARATSPALRDLPCRGRGGRTASPPGVPRWAVTGAPRHPLTLGATSC